MLAYKSCLIDYPQIFDNFNSLLAVLWPFYKIASRRAFSSYARKLNHLTAIIHVRSFFYVKVRAGCNYSLTRRTVKSSPEKIKRVSMNLHKRFSIQNLHRVWHDWPNFFWAFSFTETVNLELHVPWRRQKLTSKSVNASIFVLHNIIASLHHSEAILRNYAIISGFGVLACAAAKICCKKWLLLEHFLCIYFLVERKITIAPTDESFESTLFNEGLNLFR